MDVQFMQLSILEKRDICLGGSQITISQILKIVERE